MNNSVKKVGKVTKRTYNKKVKRFSKEFADTFHALVKFVKDNCIGDYDEVLDSLCSIVDKYINLNSAAQEWSHKQGIDHHRFIMDIDNDMDV